MDGRSRRRMWVVPKRVDSFEGNGVSSSVATIVLF